MSRATSHSIGDLWELFEALRFAAPAFQEANGRALMLAREITAVQDTDNEGVWMRSNEQREECARKNHGSNRESTTVAHRLLFGFLPAMFAAVRVGCSAVGKVAQEGIRLGRATR